MTDDDKYTSLAGDFIANASDHAIRAIKEQKSGATNPMNGVTLQASPKFLLSRIYQQEFVDRMNCEGL